MFLESENEIIENYDSNKDPEYIPPGLQKIDNTLLSVETEVNYSYFIIKQNMLKILIIMKLYFYFVLVIKILYSIISYKLLIQYLLKFHFKIFLCKIILIKIIIL